MEPDQKIDKNSEEWRFICEVNMLCGMAAVERDHFLDGVEKKRGKSERNRLWAAVYEIHLELRKKGE
jgi:hypothetical protein